MKPPNFILDKQGQNVRQTQQLQQQLPAMSEISMEDE